MHQHALITTKYLHMLNSTVKVRYHIQLLTLKHVRTTRNIPKPAVLGPLLHRLRHTGLGVIIGVRSCGKKLNSPVAYRPEISTNKQHHC